MGRKLLNRTGETKLNNKNEKMTIINYRNAKDIDIKFEDGTIVENIEYGNFLKGNVKNPTKPTVFGVGVSGTEKVEDVKLYGIWVDMLRRCYDNKYQENKPTYKGCIVCDEWLCFSNFETWYNNNLWQKEVYLIPDKDITFHNMKLDNKIYSPETVLLVDSDINALFLKNDSKRGKHPIGVSYHKSSKKFRADASVRNKQESLGLFTTEQEAFESYKTYKEKHIKKLADEYKEKYPSFPDKLYKAMYEYKVDIND